MTFTLELKAVAVAQAAEVFVYYSERSPRLGERFIVALKEGYETLQRDPFFQVRKAPYRYLKLRKFPYRMVFEVQGSAVIVYQVMHTSRKPSRKFGP